MVPQTPFRARPRKSCKKRAPWRAGHAIRSCLCSPNTVFNVQILATFGTRFAHFWLKLCTFSAPVPEKGHPKNNSKKYSEKVSEMFKNDPLWHPCGGVHQVTFLMVFGIRAPGGAQDASRGAQGCPEPALVPTFADFGLSLGGF